MTLNVHDLVAALPEGIDDVDTPREAAREWMAQLQGRPVPAGALHRLWIMGGLNARIALAYLAYWIRSSYAAKDERELRLNETHLKAALKLLGTMSYLRGAVMKVGQTLAAYPKVLPEQFIDTLSRLHFDAPPMHFSLLREHMRNELGADPEELFAEFETEAFAAASLGQVHRARLKTGERVAVKVQYPNIARTIQSDFRNMMAFLMPMRLGKDWDQIRRQIEDIRVMLGQETDYVREAGLLRRAIELFAPDEGIVVPRVFDAFSTQRVLTMEYLDGVHLNEYLASGPSQAERDEYGRLIMLSSFRIAHAGRIWYADSNPGNYLFLRDGRLGVIDFGCCREFTPYEWDLYCEIGRSYFDGGHRWRNALIRSVGSDPSEPLDEEYVRFLEEYSTWFCYYMKYDDVFDFGNEAYIRRGIELVAEIAKKRYFRSEPMNIWIFRQLVGLRGLAFRLGARINMKELTEQESQGIFY